MSAWAKSAGHGAFLDEGELFLLPGHGWMVALQAAPMDTAGHRMGGTFLAHESWPMAKVLVMRDYCRGCQGRPTDWWSKPSRLKDGLCPACVAEKAGDAR